MDDAREPVADAPNEPHIYTLSIYSFGRIRRINVIYWPI